MMQAAGCRFRRGEKDKWEQGIAILIDGDNRIMVDKQGELVPTPVWDFDIIHMEGSFTIIFREDC
jgi:predicted FMN-binding regulatory protein PaiB